MMNRHDEAAGFAHEPSPTQRYAAYIAQALATPGGYLDIGRSGATLYFGDGWIAGCLPDQIKAEAIAAGLPVIDSRAIATSALLALVTRGPVIAVNRPADPPPWHALAYAPLPVVADAYRAAGAEVLNVERSGVAEEVRGE